MASKLTGYPITERRLRPIYDCLDNGNNKKALQEAEKVLKKQPNSQCAKVLKCLALLRLGKESECVEQLEAVRKEVPVEDSTLQAMTVCYREIHKPQLICELYRGANEKDPGNEEMQIHLFNSYVRVSDYAKQHQSAMTLYRLRTKNQYYFWAAMSILLQAVSHPSEILQFCIPPLSSTVEDLLESKQKWDDSQTTRLKLIEKMLDKMKDKIENEQEVLFYMAILEMQCKYNEALNILGSALGEKLDHVSRINKKVALLMKLERWTEAIVLLKSLITENPDSWSHIHHYIEAVFRLYDSSKDSDSGLPSVEKANEFISGLLNQKKSTNQRGPFLAVLEFQSCLEKRKISKQISSGTLVKYMMKYLFEFGHAECCLHDLKKYAALLAETEIKDFLNQVWTLVGLEHGKLPIDKKQMFMHLCNLELSRIFGIPTNGSPEECKQAILLLLRYLKHSHSFYNDVPETETRPCDRYALLAAHVMYDLWTETNMPNYLFEGIVICKYALKYSPSNSQLKLLQLKFYHLLGGTIGAHITYQSLDIKHMQLDTLGYFHVLSLLKNGHYNLASAVLTATWKFFTNNFKESADHIIFTYKYDAYMKIPEFIDIRDKINNSIHNMQVTLEKMLLDIFHSSSFLGTVQIVNGMEVIPYEDKVQWEKLRDNRDFNVLWEIDHHDRCFTQDAAEITINQETVLLRLRQLMLRIIVAVIHISTTTINEINDTNSSSSSESGYSSDCSSESNGNKDKHFHYSKSALIELVTVLENHLKALKKNIPTPISKVYIAAPPESRLLIILESKYVEQMLELLKFFISVIPGKGTDMGVSQTHLAASMLYFKGLMEYFLSEVLGMDNFIRINHFIQMVSLYSELLSFSCIIIGACDYIVKHLLIASAKKSKKKKEGGNPALELPQDIDWRVELISSLASFLIDNNENVMELLKNFEKMLTEMSSVLGEVSIIQELEDKVERELLLEISRSVNETILNSYVLCLTEMRNLLKIKPKYIGNLVKH